MDKQLVEIFSHGTSKPRDQAPYQSNRSIPGRTVRIDAGLCQIAARGRNAMGSPLLHGTSGRWMEYSLRYLSEQYQNNITR